MSMARNCGRAGSGATVHCPNPHPRSKPCRYNIPANADIDTAGAKYDGWRASLQLLLQTLDTQGPFFGVVGFSQVRMGLR